MIVGVVTDLEMTFTGDLFKVVCENNEFVFEIAIFKKQNKKKKKKKNGYGLLKISR